MLIMSDWNSWSFNDDRELVSAVLIGGDEEERKWNVAIQKSGGGGGAFTCN